jgi:asparagine synthase (glutamine-hydrolysing)
MCGISGIVRFDGGAVDREALARMNAALAHRGPDASGIVAENGAGLGHTRLSILDLEGGAQPMRSGDGSLWITFNGEIFNYVELREELARKGRRFLTRSDTEVLLRLYEEEGDACVERLNGQWAFAVWDARRRRLFLSRDRLGVRPLFYTARPGALAFASEVKALFADPAQPRALDLRALAQVLTFWVPLPPRTPFHGVLELPPGCSLVADGDGVRVARHWALAPKGDAPADEDEAEARLLALLEDATRLRLRADVPVGAYLSGGLDSTFTAALVDAERRRTGGGALRTFSVSFDDPEFDESRFQELAARRLGVRHVDVRCRYEDLARAFPAVVWHAERPLVRTAPAPLYLLARKVREEGFKVVVTGEGADEVLGGYDIYKEAKVRRFCAAQPDSRRRPLLLRALYPYMESLRRSSPEYLKAFFRARPEDVADPCFSHLPRWEVTAKTQAFLAGGAAAAGAHDAYAELRAALPAEFAAWPPLVRAQYLETAFLLPGYILSSQGDRVAMAHAVEGRFPFLDYRVVEFAFSLPPRMKLRGLVEKHLLKRAARGLVPEEIRARPKQPFRAPDAKSFFDPESGRARADYVEALLAADRIRRHGVFDPERVELLVRKARSGRLIGVKDNMALVGILSTQLLVEQMIEHVRRWD